MGMCFQIAKRVLILLFVLALLGGCDAMDEILPSSGTYKVNARVNDLSLDEISFVSSNAKIQPFFEESVHNDPDVTGLIVFLKDAKGEITGWKVIYALNGYTTKSQEIAKNSQPQKKQENVSKKDDESSSDDNVSLDEDEIDDADEEAQNTKQFNHGEEFLITVKNMDDLPLFPLPPALPVGRYTLVSQVLNEDGILDKTEKPFFYLADTVFSFEGILIHQPGIAVSPQLIYKNTVIMLEAKLEFDRGLDPYVVWYNGKKIISEGSYSSGGGNLLWGAPEQSGFFSLRAEAFPVANRQELTGYVKDISLLVSTKNPDMHLLSEVTPNLLSWYKFEGNLNDSIKSSEEQVLKPENKTSPKWMPAGGTYGLVTGLNDVYTLPRVVFSDKKTESWQILFRFKPLNNGEILSVQTGVSSNVAISLGVDGDKLILTLASSQVSVSEAITLPETDLFITAKIDVSALPDHLSTALTIKGNFSDVSELSIAPIVLETETTGGYIITLGDRQGTAAQSQKYSALWDELAIISDAPFEQRSLESNVKNNAEKEEVINEEEQPESISGLDSAA